MVSVILPFLNAERFIQEAIASVFEQTYDRWELLLIDDGSSDSSTNIALQHARQYPEKVSYLEHAQHQNVGTSASRNLGIHRAKGEYIAFLDSDDVWLPYKLEQQVSILAAYPEAAMIYGRSRYWYGWTGNPEDGQRDFVLKLGLDPNSLVKPPALVKLFLRKEVPAPCPSDVLVRRKVAAGIGGFEEQFRGIYQLFEDQVFFAKLCLRAAVFPVDECWDKYRQHPDSCVAAVKRAGQYHTVRQYFLSWMEQYVSEQGYRGTEVWQVLQTELLLYRHPTLFRVQGYGRYVTRRMQGLLARLRRSVSSASSQH